MLDIVKYRLNIQNIKLSKCYQNVIKMWNFQIMTFMPVTQIETNEIEEISLGEFYFKFDSK